MKLKILFPILFLFIGVACAKTSELSDEARTRGTQIAQELVNADLQNEMEMQNIVLKAKAVKSEYILIGDSIAAQHFEEAYIQSVKEQNDSLAQILFNQNP